MKISDAAAAILAGLDQHGAMLISGPPACGKTRLLQEVAEAFEHAGPPPTTAEAALKQQGFVAIPKFTTQTQETGISRPSPGRLKRHVQRIAFASSTKARDFTTGYAPVPNGGYQVVSGALVTANEAALSGSASLLIVDEMNRGPAVQLFADALVAMEKDRRLLPDDKVGAGSWPMRILDAETGQPKDYYLSHHLYVLAAMNQADVSVEPMDTAFIRRFTPFALKPDASPVRTILGAAGAGTELPSDNPSAAEIVEVLVRAWQHVNQQIEIGLSPELRIGHGIMLSSPQVPANRAAAEQMALHSWSKIAAHVKEVFFGDVIGLSLALRAEPGSPGYSLVDVSYGQDQRQHLQEPEINSTSIYSVLRQVAG